MNSHFITLLIGISCLIAGVISVVQVNNNKEWDNVRNSPNCKGLSTCGEAQYNSRNNELALAGVAFLVNGIILVSTALYCLYFYRSVSLLQYLAGCVILLAVGGGVLVAVKNK